MVTQKDELIEREEKWEWVAKQNNYRCARCHQIPPHSERDIFFATGLCGRCHHIMNKDD